MRFSIPADFDLQGFLIACVAGGARLHKDLETDDPVGAVVIASDVMLVILSTDTEAIQTTITTEATSRGGVAI